VVEEAEGAMLAKKKKIWIISLTLSRDLRRKIRSKIPSLKRKTRFTIRDLKDKTTLKEEEPEADIADVAVLKADTGREPMILNKNVIGITSEMRGLVTEIMKKRRFRKLPKNQRMKSTTLKVRIKPTRVLRREETVKIGETPLTIRRSLREGGSMMVHLLSKKKNQKE
jgi:hypothetical protein